MTTIAAHYILWTQHGIESNNVCNME